MGEKGSYSKETRSGLVIATLKEGSLGTKSLPQKEARVELLPKENPYPQRSQMGGNQMQVESKLSPDDWRCPSSKGGTLRGGSFGLRDSS